MLVALGNLYSLCVCGVCSVLFLKITGRGPQGISPVLRKAKSCDTRISCAPRYTLFIVFYLLFSPLGQVRSFFSFCTHHFPCVSFPFLSFFYILLLFFLLFASLVFYCTFVSPLFFFGVFVIYSRCRYIYFWNSSLFVVININSL